SGPPGRHRDAEAVIVLLRGEPERAQGGVDRLVAQVLADPVDQELPVDLDLRVAGGRHEHVLHAVGHGTRRDLRQQVQEQASREVHPLGVQALLIPCRGIGPHPQLLAGASDDLRLEARRLQYEAPGSWAQRGAVPAHDAGGGGDLPGVADHGESRAELRGLPFSSFTSPGSVASTADNGSDSWPASQTWGGWPGVNLT